MHQRGFTLVELLVSMAILGLITAPLGTAIRQTMVLTADNNTRVRALVSMENAARWLSGDIRIAQDTGLATSSSDSTLQLSWTDWAESAQYDNYNADNVVYKRYRVTYSLNGTDMEQDYEVCDDWDFDAVPSVCSVAWTTTTQVVATPVSSLLFTRDAGYLFTVDLTSFPKGSGFAGQTKSYQFEGPLLAAPAPI